MPLYPGATNPVGQPPKFDEPRRLNENKKVGHCGPVAQLGARFHGMEEVIGSIPIRSTKLHQQHSECDSETDRVSETKEFLCRCLPASFWVIT